jgi:hypothetical protein
LKQNLIGWEKGKGDFRKRRENFEEKKKKPGFGGILSKEKETSCLNSERKLCCLFLWEKIEELL